MNKAILDQFAQLESQVDAEYLYSKIAGDPKLESKHGFRLDSVHKIIGILKKLKFEIKSVADIEGIPGIGAGTKSRVKEILDTGVLSELKNKYPPKIQKKIDDIRSLKQVIGIGPVGAKELVLDHRIGSVEELKKAIHDGKIKVSDTVKLGLKYYGLVEGAIPRKETAEIETYLQQKASEIEPQLKVVICGSYRRGKPTSGDIDVLLYHPKMITFAEYEEPEKYGFRQYLELFIERLSEDGFILDNLNYNFQHSYMGFSRYRKNPIRRLDMHIVPYESLATSLLAHTGPFELNALMRAIAKRRDMKLNEYGLFKINARGQQIARIETPTEADVFRALNLPPLAPDERESYSMGRTKKTKESLK